MTAHTATRELDGLHALPPPPDWVQGATPMRDAEFLFDMITTHKPSTVVEIGVAAGVSSAYMLYALDTLPEVPGGRVLHSCDIQPACYFDAAWATGQAAQTIYPRPRAKWILDTNIDTRRLSQTLAPGSVDLTFIDANHYHPWPLLDLLHMAVLAKPGSWVMLHDVNLPVIAPEFPAWGAKFLFDEWPFEKFVGGGPEGNIGAVKLPTDLTRLIPFAAELLERTWEHDPTMWHVALPEPFAPLQEIVRARIERNDRLALARKHIQERAFVPALHLADEVLATAPANLEALELRMRALREVGRFEMACDVARGILSLDALNQSARETLNLLSSALAKPAVETAAGLDRSFASEIPHAFMLRIQQSVHHYRYKGMQMVKDPFDIALYPMLLWELHPRTVIEIGSKSGGSGRWFGDQLKTFGIDGHVYSVDVVPVRGLNSDNVTFLEGNGRELERVFSNDLLATLPKPWLVIEDADHSHETSLAVLRFFHPHLEKGDYIVVEDGIISDLYPESCPDHSSGPHLALKEFLAQEGASYAIDPDYCDFFGRNVTWATNGFLKRVK